MALKSYGLLIGKLSGSRPQSGGHSHWLLMVQPKLPGHPVYRVAVNLQPIPRGKPPDLEYQVVKFAAEDPLIRKLTAVGATPDFLLADAHPTQPRLDFVRGSVVDPKKFVVTPFRDAFEAAVAEALKDVHAAVVVFGTGYPTNNLTKTTEPTGFRGVENVHMNQGAMNRINDAPHYRENGPDQDGGIIFILRSGYQGFFVKFASQTLATDANGNPTKTRIPEIDNTHPAVLKAIMPPIPRATAVASRTAAPRPKTGAAQPSGTPNKNGYLFADVNPNDATGTYIPDDDANTYKTPYVMTRSLGHTRGPVPTPRGYPRLDLSQIVGAKPPGYAKDSVSERIAFDVIGDSGAPSQAQLTKYEAKVTDLMARDAQASPPAFLFHVGDVVYFYGEENYYYSQFYEPFRAYPAPIFAIPGNHDGITYDDAMVSLDSFQQAFCATAPDRWAGSGGILRSAMTQPGVYFTLDAPLLSIIGLYSNCGESFGWLDQQQLVFLYQELTRLKKLRKNGLPAVILAIHHFPRWFPAQKPKDPTSTAIDATCKKAGFWPDAVICGHAHLYQRVVRQDIGQDIPYVMTGAGGYGVSPPEELGKSYMAQIASSGTRLSRVLMESGYVRATVTKPVAGDATLRFEYHSVQQTTNEPDDVCTVNLHTSKLV
jgi:uncharacterized protein YukJ